MREGYRRQQPGAPLRFVWPLCWVWDSARRVCFAAGIFRGGHLSWGADAGGLVSGERGFDVRGV